MDPKHSAQDVIRCDLCETPDSPLYCGICHLNLCSHCAGEHLLDKTKEHKVVPFERRRSIINYPKCQKHSTKECELHCEQCNVPICSLCVSSKEHNNHTVEDIVQSLQKMKEAIQTDLQELENHIYPQYQEAVTRTQIQKKDGEEHLQTLNKTLTSQGEALHQEIDNIIQKIQSEINDMDSQHLAFTNKQEEAINHTITNLQQFISDIKEMLKSDDICLVSTYRSRNDEFRTLPAQFQVSLPSFSTQVINREQISQLVGSLSELVITTKQHGSPIESPVSAYSLPAILLSNDPANPLEEHDDPIQFPDTVSSFPIRLFIEEPQKLRDIKTEFGALNRLRNMSCLSESEFWSCGWDKNLRRYNNQGELLKSLQTKSGKEPWSIAVTRSGDLVYTDFDDRSINIVNNTEIQPLVRLKGWKPLYLCRTSSDDLLVTMISDKKKSKVVRYSGSTEKESFQYDSDGQPLYSSNPKYVDKYVSENRNLDICVADCDARAVVVVSAVGNLRFRYKGSRFDTEKSFTPGGITTDSQGKILTADWTNHCIHILDQDGNFLRYIDICELHRPMGLSVDSTDNLLVAELTTGKVKKIQYYL